MRQALSGEVVPPPPSMRHAAVPRLTRLEPDDDAAVFDPTVFGPDAAAGSAQEIIPAPLQDKTTLAPVRRGGLAGLVVLVLTALGALGWSAWALGPAAAVPPEAASPAAGAASATGVGALPTAIAALPRPPEAVVAPASPPPPLPVLPTAHVIPNSRTSAVPVATAARASVSVSVSASAPATTPRQRLTETPITNPTPAREAAPRGPKDICGDRNFFALAVCIDRECQAPQLRAHPQCVESRRAEEQRQRRMEQ